MDNEYVYTERFFQYELKAEDFYNYEKNACFIGRLSMVGGV